MIARLLLLALLVSPVSSFAQEDCPEHQTPNTADHLVMHARGCPNNHEVNTLCSLINSNLREAQGSRNRFVYQTVIENASCVMPNDSVAVKKRKIGEFWNRYGNQVGCTIANASVGNGLLPKFAIDKMFDSFILDITRNWQVNLNRVDPADGRTVLDFIIDKITRERSINSPLVTRLETYKTLLIAAGAKRRAELPANQR